VFGSRVREYRHRLGLTQEELAWMTKVSSRTIRDIETGRVSRPHAGTIRRLAGAFRLQGREREEFLQEATRARDEVAAGTDIAPDVPLAGLVDGVPDRSAGCAAAPGEDVDVAAARSWVYQSLTGQAAELFTLMSPRSGPGITAEAAASLITASIADVRLSLGELVRVRLPAELDSGRYLLPHLLGALGAELTEIFDSEEARRAATQRAANT